ncbi:MAG: methyltransferase domain-containing protein [Actinomycetota bacterium]
MSSDEAHAGAQHFCDLVRPGLSLGRREKLLVAGCGLGHEALHIRHDLDLDVTGVDISTQWGSDYGSGVSNFALLEESLLELPFPDNTFDLVFYHHVIEHVDDPATSLDELRRVLTPGGLIYIGTPNRHRAVGYIGSQGVTTRQKIEWNWQDYKARLRNRFRNEDGAHAGFTEVELSNLLKGRFTDIHFLTEDYLRFKYGERLNHRLLDLVCKRPILEIAAPSVYVVARKPSSDH